MNDLDMEAALARTKAKLAAEKESVEARRAAALAAEKARIQGLRDEEEKRHREAEEENRKAEEEAARKREEEEAAAAKAKAEAEAAKAKEGEGEDKKEGDPPADAVANAAAAAEPKGASEAAKAEAEAREAQAQAHAQPEEEEDPEAAAADKRMRAFFAEEKARALAWPSAADMARTEKDVGEDAMDSGVILPVHPAKGVKRAPITERPPLHRPRGETAIERILVMFSSTDRGQRIAHMWSGDKMETMSVTMASVAALCERGFDVTAWFIAAWPIAEEDAGIREALYCERIKK